MTLKDLARAALLELQRRGETATPDRYAEQFCKAAKKYRLILDDCNKLESHLSRLPEGLQEQLSHYTMHSVDDLVQVLSSMLQRYKSEEWQNAYFALDSLMRTLLELPKSLGESELDALALETLQRLESSHDPKMLETLKEKWQRVLRERRARAEEIPASSKALPKEPPMELAFSLRRVSWPEFMVCGFGFFNLDAIKQEHGEAAVEKIMRSFEMLARKTIQGGIEVSMQPEGAQMLFEAQGEGEARGRLERFVELLVHSAFLYKSTKLHLQACAGAAFAPKGAEVQEVWNLAHQRLERAREKGNGALVLL